ncbi:sigma-54-dependent Fis family transcriptional regulator, partial [Candidatus Sumerlaeota bacterium]|nr:sigma-54-dependent Fis family transcriptional regulator [Candidatus Sumerlaeota bacterium]
MPARKKILIVEDEKNTRDGMKWGLEGRDYEVATSASAAEALEVLAQSPADLVITDLKMPGMDGLQLLERLKALDASMEVIVITAHGTVETAVEAMRKGAFDYQTKPIRLDELKLVINRALHSQSLARENEELHKVVEERYGFQNIVGRSPAMEAIFQTVRQVAPSKATVLVQGESGTGKELIARAIHFNSPRARRPFITVNCGALAQGLLESELFGHEKGAFTHAVRSKPGRFEMADGGSIFLDEISETSAEFQVKLLRVLQEQTLERVGGTETIKVDVRVIAATNRKLEQLVAEGKFREDLFYRLNVVPISLPPLRERTEDIPLLAAAFLKEFGEQNGKPGVRLSPKTLALLQQYDWPGNVRQLRNVIEGLVVMTSTKEIQPRALPEQVR